MDFEDGPERGGQLREAARVFSELRFLVPLGAQQHFFVDEVEDCLIGPQRRFALQVRLHRNRRARPPAPRLIGQGQAQRRPVL